MKALSVLGCRLSFVSALLWAGLVAPGNWAAASVQIQSSEVLFQTAPYANTVFQPAQAHHPWIQYAANGDIGMVYKKTTYNAGRFTLQLVYRVFRPNGTSAEDVVTSVVSTASGTMSNIVMLFYDPWLQPHILQNASGNRNGSVRPYIEHYWKTDAGWQHEFIDYPFIPHNLDFVADMDADGFLHVLARDNNLQGDIGQMTIDYYLYYMTNRTGAWTCQAIEHCLWPEQPTWWNTYAGNISIAADAQGFAHVAYLIVYLPSPWYGTAECRYATNKGGSWHMEVVFGPGDYDAFAGNYPCLAVRPNGDPAMTTVFQSFARTGSLGNEYLCYSTRTGPNAWQTQTVVATGDGYYGTDGNHFTGVWARLRFDQSGHPHIVFSDRASYHNPYQITYVGQIRYAFHNGSAWELTTLYRQNPPVDAYNNDQMRAPHLAVSPGGGRLGVAGIRQLRSNSQYSFDVVRIQAANTAGDDGGNTLRICGWTARQTWITYVSASGALRAKTRAGDNGFYDFALLPRHWAGTVTPSKVHCAFSPPSRTYSNLDASQDNQNFTLLTGAIEGSVRNTETGRQPSGVLVKLFRSDGSSTGLSQTTDAQGNFRFNDVEPGEYFLTLTLAGYKPGRWPYDGCFVVQSNQTYTRWQIPLSPLATRAARWQAYR